MKNYFFNPLTLRLRRDCASVKVSEIIFQSLYLVGQRVFRAVDFKMEVAAGRAVGVAGAAHIADKFFFFDVLADLRFGFFKVRVKGFNTVGMFYGNGIAIAIIPAVIIYSFNDYAFSCRVNRRAAAVGDVNSIESVQLSPIPADGWRGNPKLTRFFL